MCVHRIMAITSAFQADDAGSIPAARSNSFLSQNHFYLFEKQRLMAFFCICHLKISYLNHAKMNTVAITVFMFDICRLCTGCAQFSEVFPPVHNSFSKPLSSQSSLESGVNLKSFYRKRMLDRRFTQIRAHFCFWHHSSASCPD